MPDDRELTAERLGLALLILLHVAVCCVSLIYAAQYYGMFHLVTNPAGLPGAIVTVVALTPVALLFVLAPFSFGYVVGFYFYTMVLCYLWLNFFSDFSYGRPGAGLSAAASIVVFLLPALFIASPVRQVATMSLRRFDVLLKAIFLLCLATVIAGASYNFRLVWPTDVSNLRSDPFPTILNYLIGITSSALLPFLFACFLARRDYWLAVAVLGLLFFYYPVAMSKTAFFAPAWLVLMAVLLKVFKCRTVVVLSLLLPAAAGVILIFLLKNELVPSQIAMPYFYTVNFRMIAIPAIAMDVYNDFFSRHELTHFCQIRMLKPIMSCPYQDQLSIVMLNNYPVGGNFNASLFATEGIASVGVWLAPVSVFACGLVIALANRLSAGLSPSFILVSGAMMPLVLLNVPLATALLSHGAGLLFLLWYITPRGMFEKETAERTLPAMG